MACVGLLLIALFLQLKQEGFREEGSEEASSAETEMDNNEGSFKNLSQDEKDMIQHSYQLAHNFWLQGKYRLASDQLDKIHNLIDNYKNSNKMQEECNTAIKINKDLEDNQRRMEEAEQLKIKVASIINKCRSLVNENVNMGNLKKCLSPAVELDPENLEITSLQKEAASYIELQQQRFRDRKKRQKKIQGFKALLRKAERLGKEEKFSSSISVYKKVVRSPFSSLKIEANRGIASVERARKDKVNTLRMKSDAAYKYNKLNESVVLLQQALRIFPQNKEVQSKLKKQSKELELKMKSYYQEAILEEGMGNLTTAKNRWKKIMEEDVKGNNYFNKAKIKLKRYGEL